MIERARAWLEANPTSLYRLVALTLFIVFIAMSLRTSVYPTILGRYSQRYAIYLLQVLVLVFCSIFLSFPVIRNRLFRQTVMPMPDRHFQCVFWPGMALMVSGYLINQWLSTVNQWPFWLTYLIDAICVSIFFGLLLFLYRQLRWKEEFRWLSAKRIVLGLCLIHVGVMVIAFGDYPTLFTNDEPLELGDSIFYARTFGEMNSINLEWNKDNWLDHQFIIYLYGLLQLLTRIGWLQARMISLLLSLVATPFLFLAARKLYGNLGAWATALLAFHIPLHYNWIRSDPWVTTAVAITILTFLIAHDSEQMIRKAKTASFACGFFVLSTIEGHFYGGIFVLMFSAHYIGKQCQHFRNEGFRLRSDVLFFGLGSATFAAFWVWYHLLIPGISITDLFILLAKTYNRERHVAQSEYSGLLRNVEVSIAFLRAYLSYHFSELGLGVLLILGVVWRNRRRS